MMCHVTHAFAGRLVMAACSLVAPLSANACGGAPSAPVHETTTSRGAAHAPQDHGARGPGAFDGPRASGLAGTNGEASTSEPSEKEQRATAGVSGGASTGRVWPHASYPSEDEQKAQSDRIAKDPGPIESNWSPPGKTERYGHAEGLIRAPYAKVRAKLVDFAHYKDLAGPKFRTVNVVDKTLAGTDVYFQLPIMKGLVTIWYVTRFGAPQPGPGGGDIVEGTFVRGNIKGMHIVLTARPGPDDKSSVLVCDLNLAIYLPAPQSALDEELRDACGDAVKAVRARTTQAGAAR